MGNDNSKSKLNRDDQEFAMKDAPHLEHSKTLTESAIDTINEFGGFKIIEKSKDGFVSVAGPFIPDSE